MSGVIHLLPDHIANQIAAGEVIQRPASVIKETVENAIDAGATEIKVIIKDAGKTLIQIIDNGSGMNAEDAVLCFERHATSKISVADDLFALKTKGFRGEALASIAAIAHVTLKTRLHSEETGNLIQIEGSKITNQEETICSKGTSIEIKNLFYNVPARRNFLKSDSVEFGHIREEFIRISMAHPDLNFSLYHNDTEVYRMVSGILRKRINDILGKSSNDKLVPIEEKTDIVTLSGYVGKPEFAKKTRGEQYIFVNNRFFKDAYFNNAVSKAFDGLLPQKYFPSYFLFLEIDPSRIDVNVHPTKTEIKFEEERSIYPIILSSIRQALGKYNISPTLDFEQETSFDLPHSMRNMPVVEPTIKVDPTFNPFKTSTDSTSRSTDNSFSKAIKAEGFGNKDLNPKDWEAFYNIEEADEPIQEKLEIEVEESSLDVRQLILKGRYILSPLPRGFMIIDIPRAVERIVYDELINKFILNPISSQQLLFPISIEVSKNEIDHWNENRSLLERFGWSWSVNENNIEVNAVPSILQEEAIQPCILQIMESIVFAKIDKGEIAHALSMSIASSAGKIKKVEHQQSAEQLIEELFRCPEHSFSPSGKKILDKLTFEELSNRFS
jgi:DNA mismatch repair protein MutL